MDGAVLPFHPFFAWYVRYSLKLKILCDDSFDSSQNCAIFRVFGQTVGFSVKYASYEPLWGLKPRENGPKLFNLNIFLNIMPEERQLLDIWNWHFFALEDSGTHQDGVDQFLTYFPVGFVTIEFVGIIVICGLLL